MVSVSFIIPTLNEQASVVAAIERAHAAGACEVIVVDGCSSDQTVAVASKTNAHVISSAAGRGRQMNAGATAASGDVLLFLHCDTWLAPSASEQINAACAHRTNCWGGFEQRIEAPGLAYRMIERGNAWRVKCQRLIYGDQGLFVTRRLFEQAGSYPDLPLMEDFTLSQRLANTGMPILLDGPIHVSARRWQRTGVARQTLRNWSIAAAYRMGVSPERLAEWYEA